MKLQFPWHVSVAILSMVKLFERMSYYGMRALIVIYAVDVMALDNVDAIKYYAIFTTAIYIIQAPMGLISDFVLTQKYGTLAGFILLLAGYSVLIIPNIIATLVALLLITLGVSLVTPNMLVLMGRLFKKQDQKRNTGFVVFYTAVNLGAFFGVLLLSFASDDLGYHYGFGLAALFTLIALIIYAIFMNSFQLIEDNSVSTSIKRVDRHPEILDYQTSATPPPLNRRDSKVVEKLVMIFILTMVGVLFWQLFEISSGQHHQTLSMAGSISILGFEIQPYSIFNLQSLVIIPVALAFILIWNFGWMKSSIILVGCGLLFLALNMVFTHFIDASSNISIALFSFLGIVVFSIGEIIISAVAISYVTRLSPVKFSSTIIGIYLCFLALGMRLIGYFVEYWDSINLLLLAVIPVILGILIITLRKVLLQLTGGMD